MQIVSYVAAALVTLNFIGSAQSRPDETPNIVFILADDLGITDIREYARHFTGEKTEDLFFETPNLDDLVRSGIAFSQSYANQLCSPTRAAILTGRIASRLGVTTATPTTRTYHNQGLPLPEGYAPHDAFAHKDKIPGELAWINAHSNTAINPSIPTLPKVLKTHKSTFLGKWHLGGHGAAERQPAAHGFHELAYFDAGGSPYFNWQKTWDRKNSTFPKISGPFRKGKSGGEPLANYLTDDLTARACEFIREQKEKSRPFLLYYCPFAVHTPFQAPEQTTSHFAQRKQRGHLERANSTYAAMLKHLDDSVGAIRKTLEETGQANDTLLIFTSDNGGVEFTDPPATNNHPFKGGKACLYEGGIRVPTIFYQPGRYEGGTWCDAVIDCTDFLPTLAEITGNTVPHGIDGRSIVPLLNTPTSPGPERTLIWHYPFNVKVKHPDHGTPLTPHSAIRVGNHKLIWDWHGRLELYDIPADPRERNNLAEEKPILVRSLHERLKAWLDANVAPRYMPKLDPAIDAEKITIPFSFADLREPQPRPNLTDKP